MKYYIFFVNNNYQKSIEDFRKDFLEIKEKFNLLEIEKFLLKNNDQYLVDGINQYKDL